MTVNASRQRSRTPADFRALVVVPVVFVVCLWLVLSGGTRGASREAGADPNRGRPAPGPTEAQMQELFARVQQAMNSG
jgi:hypothetical protein